MAPTPDPRAPSNRHWRTYVARAWTRRCPRCGTGPLFASRFRLCEKCSECALLYRREPGAMTGQMYLSAAVTEIFAAILVGVVFISTDWSAGVSIAVCLPLLIGFTFWFLPKAMGLWVAIEYMTDVGNREPWLEEDGGPSIDPPG